MNILGINAYHADASACLVQNGKLIAACEEERFNRVKHCAGLPHLATAFCLKEGKIGFEDLDFIAVSRDPMANIGNKLFYTLFNAFKMIESMPIDIFASVNLFYGIWMVLTNHIY